MVGDAPTAAAVTAGETAKIVLRAQIQGGWKLYALTQPAGGPQKLAIAVAKDAPFTITEKQIVAPAPKTHEGRELRDRTRMYYEKEVAFTVPVAVRRRRVRPGRTIPLEVTFQACGDELCLRPFTQKLSVPVNVR